ncbi:MAG: hypothetical protein N2V72_04795 [Methanophagales archaeon]|nr:hypothetical protein [Methanophagales archaeon]
MHVRIHEDDEIIIKSKKLRMIYILDTMQSSDLEDTIAYLIETGLSKAEKMGEILQIMEGILRRDERFKGIAAEMKRYRETIFSRSMPFTMIEARSILSKLRKWQNAIHRAVSAQNSVEFRPDSER